MSKHFNNDFNVWYNVLLHDEIYRFSSDHKYRSLWIENQKSVNFNLKLHENT